MNDTPSAFIDTLIWIGGAISLLGVLGIFWCILRVTRVRRSGADDTAIRAEIQAVMPWNLGALFLSVIGLMLVVIGITLG